LRSLLFLIGSKKFSLILPVSEQPKQDKFKVWTQYLKFPSHMSGHRLSEVDRKLYFRHLLNCSVPAPNNKRSVDQITESSG
jgi:hypothetical protein